MISSVIVKDDFVGTCDPKDALASSLILLHFASGHYGSLHVGGIRTYLMD
jgi:hypothetical protein